MMGPSRRLGAFALCALCSMSASAGAPAEPATGLDRGAMNPAIRPQDDLFGAMNGKWLDQTPIPPDKPEYGALYQLRDKSDERVKGLIEELAARKLDPDSVPGKVAAFYGAFMDTETIDKLGRRSFDARMRQIDAVDDQMKIARWIGDAQGTFRAPFALRIGADYKHPDRYVLTIWQSGLGLPNRDYYLKDDARFAAARAAYATYLQTLLRGVGDVDPAAGAADVFAFERRLAQAQWEPATNRDAEKTYNPVEVAQLSQQAPGFAWGEFLKAARIEKASTVIVGQPSYATAAAQAINETPLPTLKRYLKVHLLDSVADVLPQSYRDARFEFRGRALRGMEQDLPRWARRSGRSSWRASFRPTTRRGRWRWSKTCWRLIASRSTA